MAIRIRCFPSTDRAFFEYVHQAAAAVIEADAANTDAAARVEAAVRERYPNVRISTRSGLAILWSNEPHWYAYRDGRPDARGPGAALGRGQRAISRAIRAVRRKERAA
jgi:hypothetical protein